MCFLRYRTIGLVGSSPSCKESENPLGREREREKDSGDEKKKKRQRDSGDEKKKKKKRHNQ